MVNRIVKKSLGLLARRVPPKLGARSVPIVSFHIEPTVNLVTMWHTRAAVLSKNMIA